MHRAFLARPTRLVSFLLTVGILCWSDSFPSAAAQPLSVEANRVVEIGLTASDPDSIEGKVEVDAIFTTPSGETRRVPAFWAGDDRWAVRYASPQQGAHSYTTQVVTGADAGLDGVRGTVEVTAYKGDNPLYQHGPLNVSSDRRTFEHLDGTPFLWLGDTWWMGLSSRLDWPDGFQRLAADRKQKGFSLIQIVGGLPPDMPPLDPRGAGDGGQAWTADFSRIRPEFYNAADRRIEHLADTGLVPCIVAAWKHYMPILGPEKMKRQWRNLIARYGAYPVVWCIGGEINKTRANEMFLGEFEPGMPTTKEAYRAAWTDVTRYVQETDPFGRVVGVHNQNDIHTVSDPTLLDMYFLQTGHSALPSISAQTQWFDQVRDAEHQAPMVLSEANYQWLFAEGSYDDQLQRHQYWATMLDGGAGHTYGANGIWQVNQPEKPFGPSPHGFVWGNTPWTVAMNHAASKQLGQAKQWIESLPWTDWVPASQSVAFAPWVEPATDEAAVPRWIGIPDMSDKMYLIGRTLKLPKGQHPVRATIRIASDTRYGLMVNGQMVHRRTKLDIKDSLTHRRHWEFPLLGEYLRPGENVITLRIDGEEADSGGLWIEMLIQTDDGSMTRIVSDRNWVWTKPRVGWPGDVLKLRPDDWQPVAIAQESEAAPAPGNFGPIETYGPRCASIPGRLWVVYSPAAVPVDVMQLPADETLVLQRFNPRTGKLSPEQKVQSNSLGRYQWHPPAGSGDWAFLLTADSEPESGSAKESQ